MPKWMPGQQGRQVPQEPDAAHGDYRSADDPYVQIEKPAPGMIQRTLSKLGERLSSAIVRTSKAPRIANDPLLSVLSMSEGDFASLDLNDAAVSKRHHKFLDEIYLNNRNAVAFAGMMDRLPPTRSTSQEFWFRQSLSAMNMLDARATKIGHSIAEKGSPALLQQLLQQGYSKYTQDTSGRSIADVALNHTNPRMLEIALRADEQPNQLAEWLAESAQQSGEWGEGNPQWRLYYEKLALLKAAKLLNHEHRSLFEEHSSALAVFDEIYSYAIPKELPPLPSLVRPSNLGQHGRTPDEDGARHVVPDPHKLYIWSAAISRLDNDDWGNARISFDERMKSFRHQVKQYGDFVDVPMAGWPHNSALSHLISSKPSPHTDVDSWSRAREEMMRAVLTAKPDLNMENAAGDTPVSLAIKAGDPDLVARLLGKGQPPLPNGVAPADPNWLSPTRKNYWQIAQETGNPTMLRVLEKVCGIKPEMPWSFEVANKSEKIDRVYAIDDFAPPTLKTNESLSTWREMTTRELIRLAASDQQPTKEGWAKIFDSIGPEESGRIVRLCANESGPWLEKYANTWERDENGQVKTHDDGRPHVTDELARAKLVGAGAITVALYEHIHQRAVTEVDKHPAQWAWLRNYQIDYATRTDEPGKAIGMLWLAGQDSAALNQRYERDAAELKPLVDPSPESYFAGDNQSPRMQP